MPNIAERKDVRKLEKAARLAEANRHETIRRFCSDAAGREYLWTRLAAAHIFATIPPTDYAAMAYAEGERNQGLQLLGDILTACPERFIEMMREHHDRTVESAARDADAGDDPGDELAGSEEPGWESQGESESEPEPGGRVLTEADRAAIERAT